MRWPRAQGAEVALLSSWISACHAVFTIEDILGLIAVRDPGSYARRPLGIIDLVAIAPTWLTLILPEAHFLLTIRTLRLVRIFRIAKLTECLSEVGVIITALRASRRKISVFLFAVVTMVVLIGALMYVVEGPAPGFTSIPVSMSWAIVTLTSSLDAAGSGGGWKRSGSLGYHRRVRKDQT